MWHLIGIVVLLIVGAAVHQFSGVDDSIGEEAIEAVLHFEGVDVDFSSENKAEHGLPVTTASSSGVVTTPTAEHITPID